MNPPSFNWEEMTTYVDICVWLPSPHGYDALFCLDQEPYVLVGIELDYNGEVYIAGPYVR